MDDFDVKKGSGKREFHRMKPYLVFEYLMRYSDENHPVTASELVGYLQENGINAEERSIYKDIYEINLVQLMIEEDVTIQEAQEMLEKDPSLKTVVSGKKGSYVNRRNYTVNDIRLLAECVYATKFISQTRADKLAKIVFKSQFVSENQANRIRHNAIVVGRVKSENDDVYDIVSIISNAMSKGKHIPEKISFNYMHYSISDLKQQISRKGQSYVVSPYQLVINDGNYYLLAFYDEKQSIRTYRVDRMKNVQLTGEPRTGEDAFAKINLDTYTQQVFNMYQGNKERVQLVFLNTLLDTMIDKFGKSRDVFYGKGNDKYSYVYATVDISPQFFAWVSGFGRRVIIKTPGVALKYKEYLDNIRSLYDNVDSE